MRRLALVLAMVAAAHAQERSQFLVGMATHHNPQAGFRVTAPAPWKQVTDDRFDLLVEAPAPSGAVLGVLQRFADGGLDELERMVRAENATFRFGAARELDGKAGTLRHLHGHTRGTGPRREMHVGLFARGRRGFQVVVRGRAEEAELLRRVASSVLRGFEIVPMSPVAPKLAAEASYAGFALRVPAGWQQKAIDGGMVAALPGRRVLALVSVQREARPEPYDRVVSDERAEIVKDRALADDVTVEIAGRRVTLARFPSEAPLDGSTRTTLTLWGLTGEPGAYLHVYYTAEPEIFDVYRPVALESLKSLRVR